MKKGIVFLIFIMSWMNLFSFSPICVITQVRGKKVEINVPGELFWKFRNYSVINPSGSVVGKIRFKAFFGKKAKGEITDGKHLVKKGYTVNIEEHDHPAYFIVLGKIQQKSKNYPKMLTYYKKALDCFPKEENPGAMYALIAEAEYLCGNTQIAGASLQDAMLQDPNHAETQRIKKLIQSGVSPHTNTIAKGNPYDSKPKSVKNTQKTHPKPEIQKNQKTSPAKIIYSELAKNPNKSLSEIFTSKSSEMPVNFPVNKPSNNTGGVGDYLNGKF